MQTQSQPLTCTNLQLRKITRRVTQRYDAKLAKVGLKATQYALLVNVVKLGPVRGVDLAHVMQMSASTLSRNLQPLISNGWIEIDAGTDARSRLIRVSETGRLKCAEARQKWRRAQDGITADLGLKRVLALHALIDEALALLSPVEAEEEN